MSQEGWLDRFEEWFVLRKAWQLVGKAGFTRDDVEDIQQDIRLHVLKRLPRFDPVKSSRHTFVVVLVERCAASILERRRAEKRNGGRRPQSLHAPVRDEDGDEVELHETLNADDYRPGRTEAELRDLIADVRQVVSSLPDHLQPWCSVFCQMSVRQASRELHVSRTRLRRLKDDIRAAFEEAGLDGYLREK